MALTKLASYYFSSLSALKQSPCRSDALCLLGEINQSGPNMTFKTDLTLPEPISMLQEDLAELQSRKRKRRSGETVDSNPATRAYTRKRYVALQKHDESLGHSMHGSIPETQPSPLARTQTSLPFNDNLAALYVSTRHPTQDENPNRFEAFTEPPLWDESRCLTITSDTPALLKCDCCWEMFHDTEVTYGPCSHKYCCPCLEAQVRVAMKNEPQHIPRCCGQIIPLVHPSLSEQLLEEFETRKLEFETPDRIYCHYPTCSTFIPDRSIQGRVAVCVNCLRTTCALCKAADHASRECPRDIDTEAVLSLAERAGYQRCYSCRRVVELVGGCHHIICRCGSKFCYICGRKWRGCGCYPVERILLYQGLVAAEAFIRDAPGRVFDGGKEGYIPSESTTAPQTWEDELNWRFSSWTY